MAALHKKQMSFQFNHTLASLPQGPWTIGFVQRHLGTDQLPKTELIMYLQEKADVQFLRRWKLTSSATSIRKTRNSSKLIAAYRVGRNRSTDVCLRMKMCKTHFFTVPQKYVAKEMAYYVQKWNKSCIANSSISF